MKLTLLAKDICSDGPCPAAYRSERGTYIFQGKLVHPADCDGVVDLGEDEFLVEIPADVIRSMTTQSK